MTLNRTQIPAIEIPKTITLPPYKKIHLSNGMPVYVINSGVHEITKIEWIFNAGRWFETDKHVSRFTNKMLKEGTHSFSSAQIAEEIDFYGANFSNVSNADFSSISLLSLNKHLNHLMPLVEEIIKQPSFPEHELAIKLNNSLEKLKLDKEKIEYLADEKMGFSLFGVDHPYGYISSEENYKKINIPLLKKHHQNYYNANNAVIFLAGKINDEVLNLLEKHFGQNDWKGTTASFDEKPFAPSHIKIVKEKKEKALQTALRVAFPIIEKTHPDYITLSMLNTILGGYFGSRLMSNIREEKGYTYGIYSGLAQLKKSAYCYISTEVGVNFGEAALHEIIFEIERLKRELISQEEIELVKNYLTGKLLSNFDTPFHVANQYKNLLLFGLDVDYYHRWLDTIHSMKAEMLQEVAQKYYNINEMHQIVLG